MSKQKYASIGQGVSPQLYRSDGTIYGGPSWPEVPLRHYIVGMVFLCFTAGWFYYWSTFPLILTKYVHGYPNTNYDTFMSARYGFHWWIVWGITLNALLPLFLAFALLNNLTSEWSGLHAFFSTHAIWVNVVLCILITAEWALFCNNTYTGGATPCNDYRWCGVYWPSVWCQNVGPFVPAVTTSLARNNEMLQHWAFTFVFFILACWHRSMNGYLVRYGVLH